MVMRREWELEDLIDCRTLDTRTRWTARRARPGSIRDGRAAGWPSSPRRALRVG